MESEKAVMLSLFSIPKPFRGDMAWIQRNAIQSWLWLDPACEIILLGNDEGTAEVGVEFKVRHVPHVARNEQGTPLVNSVFKEAEKVGSYGMMCYVNADIMLMSDFLPAVKRAFAQKPESVLVGRRWDVDLGEPVDFTNDWETRVRELLIERGKLHGHTGIDYFVYRKGLWYDIPPFAIGRAVWDSWLLYRARSRNVPVVDITRMVTAVHQSHDYSHHRQQWAGVWKGQEAKQNMELAGGIAHAYTLLDAQYQLTRKGLRRRMSIYYFYRRLVALSEYHRFLKPFVKLIRVVREAILSRA